MTELSPDLETYGTNMGKFDNDTYGAIYHYLMKEVPKEVSPVLEKYGTNMETLGEGTYGVIYRYQKGSDNFAIKKSKRTRETGIIPDTLTEITIYKLLKSDYIVNLLDVFKINNEIYMVLPLATESLGDIIEFEEISNDNLKRYAYQLVQGVLAMHNKGVIHRDIKPGNILYFEDTNTLKIADLGLSIADTCGKNMDPDLVYSLWWRPPEVILGMRYSEKADVWALGVVFLDMFFSYYLFGGIQDEQELLYQIFNYFGTPSRLEWPDMYNSPNIYNPVNKEGLKIIDSEFHGINEKLEDVKYNDFRDLVYRMLKINPEHRLSIQQVCAHPYFDSIRDSDCNILACDEILQNNIFNTASMTSEKKDLLLEDKKYLCTESTIVFNKISIISRCLNIYQVIAETTGKNGKEICDISIDITKKLNNNSYHVGTDWNLEWDILEKIDFQCLSSKLYDVVGIYKKYYEPDILYLAQKFTVLVDCTSLCFSSDYKKNALFSIFLACLYNRKIFSYKDYIPEFLEMYKSFLNEIKLFDSQDLPFTYLFQVTKDNLIAKLDFGANNILVI